MSRETALRRDAPTWQGELLSGVRAELPILIGVVPFGMIYGVLALGAGIPPGAAQAMSSLVFAGSAQFISTQLISHGTPALVIIVTAVVVNLRHMLYSASLAPYLKGLSPLWKWSLAYLLTDEAYAVTITRYRMPESASLDSAGDQRHWFFLGAGFTLWASWQISTAMGIFLGAQIPASWSLDFTLTLTFIALIMPALNDKPGRAAALSAGLVAVIAYQVPLKLGLILAAAVGILVGLWVEGRS